MKDYVSPQDIFEYFVSVCNRPKMYARNLDAMESSLSTIANLYFAEGLRDKYYEFLRTVNFYDEKEFNKLSMEEFGKLVLENVLMKFLSPLMKLEEKK